MRKKKLKLTKETVKNLTLDSEELGKVAGGARGAANPATVMGGTGFCPNTGSTCHSCSPSCVACPTDASMTPYINPTYMPRG